MLNKNEVLVSIIFDGTNYEGKKNCINLLMDLDTYLEKKSIANTQKELLKNLTTPTEEDDYRWEPCSDGYTATFTGGVYLISGKGVVVVLEALGEVNEEVLPHEETQVYIKNYVNLRDIVQVEVSTIEDNTELLKRELELKDVEIGLLQSFNDKLEPLLVKNTSLSYEVLKVKNEPSELKAKVLTYNKLPLHKKLWKILRGHKL